MQSNAFMETRAFIDNEGNAINSGSPKPSDGRPYSDRSFFFGCLKTKMEVRRYRNRREYGGLQKLERAWRLFGVCMFRQVIDTEEVPAWAEIQAGALGSTEWRSRFAEYL